MIRYALRPGAYVDSVVLMQLQRSLTALPGVLDAGAVMATAANRQVLAAGGLLPEGLTARADDLLVVVRTSSVAAANGALESLDELLSTRRATGAGRYLPKSLRTAVRMLPEAKWVLVSVPGAHAGRVAEEALELRRNVFLYSDNVPLEVEVGLKRQASEAGLLVLGPDCGTAIIGGAGLGFANRVRRGNVGLVAASGTGLQATASRLHNLGVGVSQAIGVGGRDLVQEVGGVTTLAALALLGDDPATEVVVLISKPPARSVAARVLSAATHIRKPVVVCLLGAAPPGRRLGDLHFAASLADAADLAAGLATSSGPATQPLLFDEAAASGEETARYVRGLFAGGTLAAAVLDGLLTSLGEVCSNLRLDGATPLPDLSRSCHHTVLDLGADELTIGRPHPMLDGAYRIERLRREAADPEVGTLLLDVVLGDGAEADPAGELAPAIAAARATAAQQERDLEVAVLLVGTDEDPQGLEGQRTALVESGARVVERVEELIELSWRRALRGSAFGLGPDAACLASPLVAINVGLDVFHDSLAEQGVSVLQVDWRPPAGGDARLGALLQRLRSP